MIDAEGKGMRSGSGGGQQQIYKDWVRMCELQACEKSMRRNMEGKFWGEKKTHNPTDQKYSKF